MSAEQSLITELEAALEGGSNEKRVDTLRRITDLFVEDSTRLSGGQIGVFDDVLQHLINRIEGKALLELSRRLAPIGNAPLGVMRQLASDDDIAVADPVLRQSTRLSNTDLIEIANTKTQAHLLAISYRPQIHESVTDVLLQRGDRQVFHKLAENDGADFSQSGFATLVKHSERDEQLAQKVGLRDDVPAALFRKLLQQATEVVRARLLDAAAPESRNRIQRVLTAISEDEKHEAGFGNEDDYAQAHARALAKQVKRELDEAAIIAAAMADRHADMIATLSVMCGAPMPLVENLLQSRHREGYLVPCKAAGLQWPTVRAILTCRSLGPAMSGDDLDSARADYFKLSQAAAARVLRFWQVRQAATKETAAPGRSDAGPALAPRAGAPSRSAR